MIRGNRKDEDNIFGWQKAIFDLSGTKSYAPFMAWMYKLREDE